MPLIRLTQRQLEAARRNGARSRGPKTPDGKARSSMNALKHGRYAKLACVLRGENKDAFHGLRQSRIRRFQPVDEAELNLVRNLASIGSRLALSLQSLMDRSKLPQFLAARESQLTFHRQAVLNQLHQLRGGWPLPSPPPQVIESEPLDPKIPAANEPKTNLQPVDSTEPLAPIEPGKTPEIPIPETACPVTRHHPDREGRIHQSICHVESRRDRVSNLNQRRAIARPAGPVL